MESDSLRSGLRQRLPMLVILFWLIQPVMDVASFFLLRFGLPTTPMLLLRTAVVVLMTLCGLVLSRRKGLYFGVLALLGGFTALHILACLQVGYENPVEDLGNLLRIFTMPLTAMAFYSFLSAHERVEQVLPKAMAACLGLIAAVMVLSTVTGTDPHTYVKSGNGICGWFYFGNCQSAILSMLAPLAVYWGLEKGKAWPALAALCGFGCLYFLGTRLSYAALAAVGICLFVGLFLVDRKRNFTSALAILLCMAVFLGAYPLSPMQAEQRKHSGVVQQRQAQLDVLYAEALEQEGQQAAFDAVYREYAPELTDRFGTTAIEEAYGYSLKYAEISGVREQKLLFGRLLMAESPTMTHLFGLELGRFTHRGTVLDVENDFHGIYFLCGWVGLGLMLLYFGVFALVLAVWILRRFRERFTLPVLCLAVAFCCGLVHAVFTAGVLRRNNASVYLGLIMAWAWYRMWKERSEQV